MDGIDISGLDQIDDEVFNGSSLDSDDDGEDMPLPDCIGIDSALQDDEELRLKFSESNSVADRPAARADRERRLELKVLKPDSIRRQILEQSMSDGNNKSHSPSASSKQTKGPQASRSHVMNITEKAGMGGIDKEKINQIIHEASRGSLFYKKQAQRQAEIHKSIEKMLNRVKAASPVQVENAKITCDKLVEDLEKQRVYNRVIVHFDLDMFFAAVEIRDNPELKDKPVAVGGESMVSTSNYVARKYGVRAAMPGFIAKKLCPELILIKPNGFKYRQASSKVFSILEQYDPELTSMSLDEAFLDLTEYVKSTLERDGLELEEYYDGTLPKIWWTRANEIVEEIRRTIFEQTQLTCSAGIACNTLLSKISTDINKPDGQYLIQGYPNDIMDFIHKTPVEKVSGIGKVSAQFLNALDIKTCGDIYSKRHYLPLVFYEINVRFYLRVALGDGSTSIKSDEQRKSKSVERTFAAVKDTLVLLDKLDNICEELCNKYLKPYRIRGRTVTVKLKRNTFTTTTKSYSMLVPTNDKLVIYSTAKSLLLSEVADEPPEISYRLLGVKLSNLADDGVTTNQLTIDAMLRNQELSKPPPVAQPKEYRVEAVEENDKSKEQDEIMLESELKTQEDEIELDQEDQEIMMVDLASQSSKSESEKSQKQQKIETFFQKKSRKLEHERSPNNTPTPDGTNTSTRYLSQEDEEEFFDADADEQNLNPQETNQLNSNDQPTELASNNDDFQCPYCFKAFPDFIRLQNHVDCCKLKIPIDVNKSFFTQQRSQQIQKSQPKQTRQKSSYNGSSQSSSLKKPIAKRQPNASSLSSAFTSKFSPSQSVISTPIKQTASSSPNATKMSFYQRFIESNSQSFSQSVKAEPFRCPHCQHGFLDFFLLQTHVMLCNKQNS